jgi:hypothetical protein
MDLATPTEFELHGFCMKLKVQSPFDACLALRVASWVTHRLVCSGVQTM